MSDIEDFKEFVEKSEMPKPTLNRRYEEDRCEQPSLEKNTRTEHSGTYVQYSKIGPVYIPTPETSPIIAPGVYNITCTANGLPAFENVSFKTDKLLRLPDSKSEMVLKEIENFWKLKDEFVNGNDKANGGYLHKRGYLLWGPPGSGKTCTAKLIMNGVIDMDGVVFVANTNPHIIINGLRAFRTIQPDTPCVVVMEDIDAIFAREGESRFLSILDGEDSIDNALFIGTTNYPSRLDRRVVCRPGRFSSIIKIGMPSAAARRLYLEHKLKDKRDIDCIVEHSEGFSLDHLKSLILGVYFEKRDLKSEIERLREMFNAVPNEDDDGRKMGI